MNEYRDRPVYPDVHANRERNRRMNELIESAEEMSPVELAKAISEFLCNGDAYTVEALRGVAFMQFQAAYEQRDEVAASDYHVIAEYARWENMLNLDPDAHPVQTMPRSIEDRFNQLSS